MVIFVGDGLARFVSISFDTFVTSLLVMIFATHSSSFRMCQTPSVSL